MQNSMKLQLKDCKETFFGRKGETLNLIILLDGYGVLDNNPGGFVQWECCGKS